ncbi:TetR/AcrR family transcriptional regulator C-terminal domain-containing protein [Lacticaseibacillus thailandensis]|uniref:TetR family transcriptional regulator n=1 Tax=Lacticaseibacillus thailandensis DSM 22698 = JCM 13996 TaxID=1423810 RepID=A0A0R2C814_9LACO|nr:TetR/AcrR family transcriptional regulator C-terminal domain-containing protein [Lacticaseibacillus thailandensis]KRM87886.1 TetR family transcriptional regulator [Lacticaseibacillus thailandensis DSM 22698 = JCM 13996]
MNRTQQKICTATKLVVVAHPFNQVNVSAIMAAAGLRRQTFYDYFRDKYDVLGFIYREEVAAAATYCRHYAYWPQTLRSMLRYFDANRAFYQRVLTLDMQNAPANVIQAHLRTTIGDVLADMQSTEHIHLAPAYVQFIQSVQSVALLAALQEWIGAAEPVTLAVENARLYRYLQDGLNGLAHSARATRVTLIK